MYSTGKSTHYSVMTYMGKESKKETDYLHMYNLGFPCGSAGKESTYNVGHLGWEDPLEKGKATYSTIPAWRIPWTI